MMRPSGSSGRVDTYACLLEFAVKRAGACGQRRNKKSVTDGLASSVRPLDRENSKREFEPALPTFSVFCRAAEIDRCCFGFFLLTLLEGDRVSVTDSQIWEEAQDWDFLVLFFYTRVFTSCFLVRTTSTTSSGVPSSS
jgi:hypothetical protein